MNPNARPLAPDSGHPLGPQTTAPPPSGKQPGQAGTQRRLLRTGLGMLSALVVAVPFTTAWQFHADRHAVTGQAPAPSTPVPASTVSGAEATQAPIVLAYHDIAPASRSAYTVRPERFDEQLAALRAAGYRTLSTAEFTNFLRTGRTPAPRTVYLTFDDGAHGLWIHADPILAKYRMKGAGYLITGRVGTHRPYYLSWPEIRRMLRSGRWDFQNHTDLAHGRAPVDASGHPASVLNNRLYLDGPAGQGRLETRNEYERRITTDLDRSLRAFATHGLPRPTLFAYPFSETTQTSNLGPDGTFILDRLLDKRFTATLTNTSSRPLPAGPRAAAAGRVQRLEVTRDTTTNSLLRDLTNWASVTPADVHRPLSATTWVSQGDPRGSGIKTLTGDASCPAQRRYVAAAYRPTATADWSSYRLRFTVGHLTGTANSASVTVRYGSLNPTALSIGHHTATLGEHGTKRRRSLHLDRAAATHIVELTVTPDSVRAEIDGRQILTLPATRALLGDRSGGFALAARRSVAGRNLPRYSDLQVHSVPGT